MNNYPLGGGVVRRGADRSGESGEIQTAIIGHMKTYTLSAHAEVVMTERSIKRE